MPAPVPMCHLTVLVAVDQVNEAVIAAVQYGQLLRPARLYGFHVDVDQEATVPLCHDWNAHFGSQVPLIVADPAGHSFRETFARTIIDDLPNANHPVVVIMPSSWGPDGQRPKSWDQTSELAAWLAGIEGVYVFVAPHLDGRALDPHQYGDSDAEDALRWATTRHELRSQ